MTKKRIAPRQANRGFPTTDLVRDQYEVSGSGEGRRFLKHMDRRLQRFSSSIDFLQDRANRLSDEDDSDLILGVESLQRETLLLRAEIREHLANGKRNLAEMTEYAEESWKQLRDTFDELRENLEPEKSPSKPPSSRAKSEDQADDEEWTPEEDEWVDTDDDWPASEVHPPRVGPKR